MQAVVFGGLALAAYVTALLFLWAAVGAALGLGRWKLGSWMLLWCGAAFGLASLTWIQQQTGATAQITLSSVLRALWLVAVGITAWADEVTVLGPVSWPAVGRLISCWALGRRFSGRVRGPATPWILYAIGVGSRLALVGLTGRFGYVGDPSVAVSTAGSYQQVLNLLSLCAPLAVAAAAVRLYCERESSARLTLRLLQSPRLNLPLALQQEASRVFVIAVLAVLIPFTVASRRMPKVALVALGLTFLLIVIPFNQAYRNTVRGSSAVLSPFPGCQRCTTGILRQTITGSDALTTLPSDLSAAATP